MVENFPGPWELRLKYDTSPGAQPLMIHTQRLNVDLTTDPAPGTAFNNIQAKTRGGIATPDLAAAIEAWLALLAPLFNVGDSFGLVELWKNVPLSYSASFISSYTPTIVAGTSVTGGGIAQQDILTFRTMEGGILRINLMEKTENIYQKNPYPTGGAAINDLFTFVFGSTNWILGRDTSYPFSALNYLVGQNEKLFRIRYRP